MIKIKELNKYYNQGKQNEIHVLNNINLTLPSLGFITILGPSGSGKTTLLNVLGGLDKMDSGSISYDNEVFTKDNLKNLDKLRREKIGYVFQNYLLDEFSTVYENLQEALNIIGIYDHEEQRKRIECVLNMVNLLKFEKKKVRSLSGGQMQRVSIARALLKNSSIIIADEPTGNLDSENTIMVMDILKKLSQKLLVLLVTHEEDMANCYSDRIIEIKDGRIVNDFVNENQNNINIKDGTTIYLKDLTKETFDNLSYKVNLYHDDSIKDAKFDLVFKNNTIYISSNQKIVNIKESSIKLKEEHYVKKDINLLEDVFTPSWNNDLKNKKKPSLLKRIKTSFLKTKYLGKKEIIFNIVFLLLGLIFGFTMFTMVSYNNPSLDEYHNDKDYYVLTNPENKYIDKYNFYPEFDRNVLYDAYQDNIVSDIILSKYSSSYVNYKPNFASNKNIFVNYYIYVDNLKYPLISGKRASQNEVVITSLLADYLIKKFNLKDYGDVIQSNLNLNAYETGYGELTKKIVGVCKGDFYGVLFNDADYYLGDVIKNYQSGGFGLKDYIDYDIVSGSNITSDTDIIVNIAYKDDSNLSLGNEFLIDGQTYTIVGYYSSSSDYSLIGSSKNLCLYYYNNGAFYKRILDYQKTYIAPTLYELTSGKLPDSGECIVANTSPLNINDAYEGLKVVGTYNLLTIDSNNSYDGLVITSKLDYLKNMGDMVPITFSIYSEKEAKDYFNKLGYELISLEKYQVNQKLMESKSEQYVNIAIVTFLIVTMILYTYFASRSKMLGEISQIGRKRSLGESKISIIRSYVSDVFVRTSITSVIGFLLSCGFSFYIRSMISTDNFAFSIIITSIILGILIVYAICIFVGILPVISLLRLTPAKINSKYDI